MRILSGPEGDGLVTNAEVQAWLKEKNFEIHKRDLEKGAIRPPSGTVTLARDIRQYLESSPSGTQTVAHVRELYEKLEKFKLLAPEKLMIANIRPEAYAHLTPLLVDVYSRFDEDQIYEILEITNNTLPKRKKASDQEEDQKDSAKDSSISQEAGNTSLTDGEGVSAPTPVDASTLDISSLAVHAGQDHAGTASAGTRDATILDYSSAMQSSQGTRVQPHNQPQTGPTPDGQGNANDSQKQQHK